nr:hypothetical protein BaRGS_001048 [Batillaria attramentaria]
MFDECLINSMTARSKLDCARRCSSDPNCKTFTFTKGSPTGTCRLHPHVMTSQSPQTAAPGARSYTVKKEVKFADDTSMVGGLFASPALESTRLFVTGNSGIMAGSLTLESERRVTPALKHAYFHSEDSLPSLAPLRIPLGSKLVKDDIVRDLVFESTETI